MIRLKPRSPKLARRHSLAKGLTRAWPFYEGGGSALYDLSGNRGNGTLSGAPPWVAGQFGGSALSLNGSTQYVDIGSGGFTNNTYAISLWAKFNDVTSTYQALFSKYTNDADSIEIFVIPGTNRLDLGNFAGSFCVIRTSANSISTGRWYHIVLSVNNTAGTAYLNGVADGTGTTSITTFSPAAYIGQRSGAFRFNGFVDDVRIYNRALSAAEVAQLYFDPFAIYRRSDYRVGVAAPAAFTYFPLVQPDSEALILRRPVMVGY